MYDVVTIVRTRDTSGYGYILTGTGSVSTLVADTDMSFPYRTIQVIVL